MLEVMHSSEVCLHHMAKSISEFKDGKTLIVKFDSVDDTLSVLCYDEEDKIDEFGTFALCLT
jgi:hypothetical protein